MQIPVLVGRAFTASDASVIIVNEQLARTLWPNEDAIGRYVRSSGRNRRVVGVVGDVRYFGLDHGTDPTLAVLTIVALLAGYLPARRATQVDPARALRDIYG